MRLEEFVDSAVKTTYRQTKCTSGERNELQSTFQMVVHTIAKSTDSGKVNCM